MGRIAEIISPRRLGRGYRWLLASSWVTNLGDGIAVAAGPLLVASLTDNAFLVSLAALLRWAAAAAVRPATPGVLSDRLDRRRIVMVADGVRAVVLVALVALMVTGTAHGGRSRSSALGLLATAEVFADNATATLTPMLVHRDDLAIANSRLQAGFITLNQLVGPPIGAALFAAGRALAVRRAGGAGRRRRTAGVAGGAARRTAAARRRRTARAARDIAEGFRWTVRHPAVRTLSLTILIFNVTFGAAWSVLVALRPAATRPRRRRIRPAEHGVGRRRAARHRRCTAGSPGGSAWATSCGSG